MINTQKFTTVFCLALAASACDASVDEAVEVEGMRSADPLIDAACPKHRQIARLVDPDAAECPAVLGWTSAFVFPNANPEDAMHGYCSYRFLGDPANAKPSLLLTDDGLTDVGSDCEVVFGETQPTDALWEVVGDSLREAFYAGIGRPSATDLNLPATEANRTKVVVAVVDSVPQPAPLNARSDHGEQMVRIIKDIACPDASVNAADCSVEVFRSLAMPRYSGGVDLNRGGFYGSYRDLARGIDNAVESWNTHDWGGPKPPLIINLSLGFELYFGDYVGEGTPAPIAIIHDAIQRARCHNALVIAAAGNKGSMCAVGALAPGSWEHLPAPDANRCAELGAPAPSGSSQYEPLVYSIGGIDHGGGLMPLSRELALPRLAALATEGVAGEKVLTGTSVSAAVATGAVALIASYNDGIPLAKAIGSLYRAGTPLKYDADYYYDNGTVNTEARAINICAGLQDACDRPYSSCSFVNLPCAGQVVPVSLTPVFDSIDTEDPASFVDVERTYAATTSCPVTCGDEELEINASASNLFEGLDPCPAPVDQVVYYATPQPNQIGCPNCTLDEPNAIVFASLDPKFDGKTIIDVTVAVSNGDTKTYFRQGPMPQLNSWDISKIELDPAKLPLDIRSAEISITFDPAEIARPIVDELLIKR